MLHPVPATLSGHVQRPSLSYSAKGSSIDSRLRFAPSTRTTENRSMSSGDKEIYDPDLHIETLKVNARNFQ